MHKDECDRSGGPRCSEENVELCQEGHEGCGYKGGILLEVRPVFKVTNDDDDDDEDPVDTVSQRLNPM